MRPSVSRAANKEIRGATCLIVTVPGASEGTHVRRMKRVWLSQDSSTLMMRLLESISGSSRSAYYYRKTRQRSILPYMGTVLANR